MPPIVDMIDTAKYSDIENARDNPVLMELPDLLSPDTNLLQISKEMEVQTTSLPVASWPSEHMMNMSLSESERLQIVNTTRGQHKNPEWHAQRLGAITASRAHRVISLMKRGKSSPDNLVRDIVHPKEIHFSNTAMSWGTMKEAVAMDDYIKCFKLSHSMVSVNTQPGLYVHPIHNYIRASPDAVINCQCHGDRLVEIKCPYSIRNEDLNTTQLKYVRFLNSTYQLVDETRGYFDQVQTQMAVCEIDCCDFVVWSKKGHIIAPVQQSVSWLDKSLPLLVSFFEEFVVPEIQTGKLLKRIKGTKNDIGE